ncbi:MAG: hypothetical protein R3B09_10225 [Nannocystaceae bacterium]
MLTSKLPASPRLPTATPNELRFIAAFTSAVIERPLLAELIALRRQRRAIEQAKAA